jgi:transcriptional regulator with XRE-family HTH domain
MTIRERRKFIGLTQWELSIKSKIHPSEMSRIETGRLRPTIEQLYRISDALGCPATVLNEHADAVR